MRLALAFLSLSLVFPVPPARAEAPAGSSFFNPPARLLDGKPGTVVWSRPVVSSPPRLAGASRSFQVIYRSRSARGKPIFVSGVVDLPPGSPPPGGWPVISWGHATTGIADRCAPSRNYSAGREAFIFTYPDRLLNSWLRRGFVIVRTDYEGLGTPGFHPYMVGESSGRAMVDIVSAARELDSHISSNFLLAGHSQGGHASLFAARGAKRWAPRLRLGAALVASPGAYIEEQESLASLRARPDAVSAFAWLIWISAARQAGQLPSSVIRNPALIQGLVGGRCIISLMHEGYVSGRTAYTYFKPGPDYPAILRAMRLMHPPTRVGAPVLILQGSADDLARPRLTRRLYKQINRDGGEVLYRSFPGASHMQVITRTDAMSEAEQWAELALIRARGSRWGAWGVYPGPTPLSPF